MSQSVFQLLADAVLMLHVAYVAFVVFGLLLILAGGWRGWAWVRNAAFRWMHLLAIAIVVVQSWFNLTCPLTTLELALRAYAGTAAYQGGFIEHWLQAILFFHAPAWVFVLLYTGFGASVFFSWFLVRPRPLLQHTAKT